MSEWKEYQLGDLLSDRPEYGANAPGINYNPQFPRFLRITDIDDDGNLVKTGIVSVERKYIEQYCLKQNDIVIARTGNTVGKAYFYNEVDGQLVFAGYLIRFRFNEKKVNSQFIFHFLKSPKYKIWVKNTLRTGAQPNINAAEYCSIKIKIPSTSKQHKIARILSTADAVIEKTQAAIAKYKAIKQGMLHDLFTRGIDPATGRLRPAYEDARHLYKQSKLGWIPKEWEVVRIEEVSSLVTNGFVGIATPYYTTSDKGVPYLYGTNIREDFIEFYDLRYISMEFHGNHIKSQLKNGDMLCVQSGHIGTCACVPDNFGEANCHALIITRFYKDMIYPEFISFYLNSSIGKHELDEIIIGSTVKHINTSDLAKHSVIKPPLKEQKEISERLKLIIRNIQTEQANLHKLQQIKAGLMADLLSGKKEVRADEEPAT